MFGSCQTQASTAIISYFFGSKGQIKPHQASRGVAHVWPGNWRALGLNAFSSSETLVNSSLLTSSQARDAGENVDGYPLVNIQKAIEKWPVEIVDLPIFTYIKVVIFHIVM